MCAKKEMLIAMDPEMAAKFQASTHVSRKYLIQVIVLTLSHHCSLEGRVRKYAED